MSIYKTVSPIVYLAPRWFVMNFLSLTHEKIDYVVGTQIDRILRENKLSKVRQNLQNCCREKATFLVKCCYSLFSFSLRIQPLHIGGLDQKRPMWSGCIRSCGFRVPLSVALNSHFAPAVKQATSQRPAALPHREPRCSYILFQFRKSNSNGHCARCVLCDSRFNIRCKSTK